MGFLSVLETRDAVDVSVSYLPHFISALFKHSFVLSASAFCFVCMHFFLSHHILPPSPSLFLFLHAVTFTHISHTSCAFALSHLPLSHLPVSDAFSSPSPPTFTLVLHQHLSHKREIRLLTFEKILLGTTVPAESQMN